MRKAYLLAKIQERDGELELVGLEVRQSPAPNNAYAAGYLWAIIEQMEGESFPVAKRQLHAYIQQNWPWLARYITTDLRNPVILRKTRARQQLREAVFSARARLADNEVADVLTEAMTGRAGSSRG